MIRPLGVPSVPVNEIETAGKIIDLMAALKASLRAQRAVPADDPLGPATWDLDDDAPLPDEDDAAGCPDPATLPDVCGMCDGTGVVRVPDESTVFDIYATCACACVAIEDDEILPFSD